MERQGITQRHATQPRRLKKELMEEEREESHRGRIPRAGGILDWRRRRGRGRGRRGKGLSWKQAERGSWRPSRPPPAAPSPQQPAGDRTALAAPSAGTVSESSSLRRRLAPPAAAPHILLLLSSPSRPRSSPTTPSLSTRPLIFAAAID